MLRQTIRTVFGVNAKSLYRLSVTLHVKVNKQLLNDKDSRQRPFYKH